MILSDREIQIAMESGAISIDPKPPANAFNSASLDLTLDPNIIVFKPPEPGLELLIDPTSAEFHPERALDRITDSIVVDTDGYCLKPNKLVLARTREEVILKPLSQVPTGRR